MGQQVKTSLGTAIIIIIAITAGMFIWQWQKNNQEAENIQTQSQIKKDINKQNKAVANEAAEFKTYENKTYKFSIQYPSDYSYTEEKMEETAGGVFYNITFGKNPKNWENSISVNVAKILYDKLAMPNGMDPSSTKDVIIGEKLGKNYDDEAYVVSDGKYRFEIVDASEGSLKDTLKTMVDSFKFIK